jgi:hypothetical protein
VEQAASTDDRFRSIVGRSGLVLALLTLGFGLVDFGGLLDMKLGILCVSIPSLMVSSECLVRQRGWLHRLGSAFAYFVFVLVVLELCRVITVPHLGWFLALALHSPVLVHAFKSTIKTLTANQLPSAERSLWAHASVALVLMGLVLGSW